MLQRRLFADPSLVAQTWAASMMLCVVMPHVGALRSDSQSGQGVANACDCIDTRSLACKCLDDLGSLVQTMVRHNESAVSRTGGHLVQRRHDRILQSAIKGYQDGVPYEPSIVGWTPGSMHLAADLASTDHSTACAGQSCVMKCARSSSGARNGILC